jgi:trehalose 6-phosphate synthase/phosphatase
LFAQAWHFKDADPHFGAWQAKDIQISLEDVLSNLPLEIIQGNHMVEVRHRSVSKARVLEKVLEFLKVEDHTLDFIFCVGDDRSDEDNFQFLAKYHERCASEVAVPPALFNVHIGNDISSQV